MGEEEALMEPGKQFEGIKVEGVTGPHVVGGMHVYKGRVAEGQTGYRGVNEAELQPQPHVIGVESRGYHSRGRYQVGPERHSRGSTQFSASPHDVMAGDKVTHHLEVDISGLPFRTLRKPEGDVVKADAGLGLGVVGEMKWDRIKRITKSDGTPDPNYADHGGYDSPGHMIAIEHLMDTGEHPKRGR